MRKYDCVGIGIAPLDYLAIVDTFPQAGAKIDSLSSTIAGGGPIPTALATLSKLGLKTAFIGKYGDDLHGKLCRKELAATGVSCRWFRKTFGAETPRATIIIEQQSGRRTVLLARGKGCNLKRSDISADMITRAHSLHLDGRDLQACLKAAKIARRNGVATFLDVGSVRNDVSSLIEHIDHLVVAEEYAKHIAGTDDPVRAARALFRRNSKSVVVTTGIKGAVGYAGDQVIRVKAFDLPVVDVTGAGDSFHGGYIYGTLAGMPMGERLTFASAVAALNCNKLGGRAGLPTTAEVNSLIRKGKFHA